MLLSILIPTLPERAHLLQRVFGLLGTHPEVEILTDPRGREVTTGQKRNDLIDRAQGEYIVFVDDDDFPQNGYIHEIIHAIRMNDYPDCVTFEGWYTENQGPRIPFVIKLGERYEARGGVVYRWPNHLVPMKKRIAQSVRFPNKTVSEDFDWSKQLNDARLVGGVWTSGPNPKFKTSFHIQKQLYYYDYRSIK